MHRTRVTRRRAAASLAVIATALVFAPSSAQAAARAPSTTGRLLVTLDTSAGTSAVRRATNAILATAGIRREGAQASQIGLVSVRPVGGLAPATLARTLQRLPAVRAVDVEHRANLRFVPNDPALTAPETTPGTPAGTTLAWWVGRIGLPAAWDVTRGDGATAAIIDTGIDSGHPDLQSKITGAIDNDATDGHGPATTDEHGHGTHVASLACASGDNAVGSVGTGLNCRLLVVKTDLGDGSVARSIVQAVDGGADAINMSFGTTGVAAPQPIVDAVKYAAAKGVILVAAASDKPVDEQGYPSNLLQPAGSGPDLATNIGLTVTAANFAGQRASFAGRGTQISLASFGAFEGPGPRGIFSAFPSNATDLERASTLLNPGGSDCRCRTSFLGDSRFAYLQGTSMAAPMVTGIAAMARHLNPDASGAEIIRAMKESAARPAGSGWTPELGWGIVDAGAAINVVRAIDRRAPQSKLTGRAKGRVVTLRWTGSDNAPANLTPSGVDVYEVFRSANRRPYRRLKRTRKTSLTMKAKAGSLYRFYTVAVDKAGNREAAPSKPDLSTRIKR